MGERKELSYTREKEVGEGLNILGFWLEERRGLSNKGTGRLESVRKKYDWKWDVLGSDTAPSREFHRVMLTMKTNWPKFHPTEQFIVSFRINLV